MKTIPYKVVQNAPRFPDVADRDVIVAAFLFPEDAIDFISRRTPSPDVRWFVLIHVLGRNEHIEIKISEANTRPDDMVDRIRI